MNYRRMKSNIIASALTKTLNNINTQQLGKLFSFGEKLSTSSKDELHQLAELCRNDDPMTNGWVKTLKSLSPNCRKKLISNLIFNHVVDGASLRDKAGNINNTHIPFLVLISPTYECNLECKGCYSSLYGSKYHLTKKEIFDVIQQFYDLGIRFFTFTGGEPFVYKPIMNIFEHFSDCYFMIFTNGTMLTESRIRKIEMFGNVSITISIEGFEEMTDWRRGRGTYKKILAAYNNLNKYGVLCGASIMATSKNHDQICSNEFWDFLINDLGVKYSWIFQYMPMGRDANMELIPTGKQRYDRFHFVEELRKSGKLAFLADFWNHGFLVNGCMSGGANYLHINAKGGVEPCVFQPYATDNIRKKRIVDILKSDFFEGYKKQIPFNDNLMQPCPIIDNPENFRKHIKNCKAIAQHEGAESYFKHSRELDKLAKEWEKYAIKIWKNEGYSDEYKAEYGLYSFKNE
ncbi:radical SAM protein (plasmid) [Escherichia albertii]|uniref:radical SAM protein n=1 Tax=Escherichia albertii TaxID=208962 RepID=UPI00235E9FBB|nr:radical SAM protein [Escherichia albertii]WDB54735.1 radical SAM protein [Escherichia albertii]